MALEGWKAGREIAVLESTREAERLASTEPHSLLVRVRIGGPSSRSPSGSVERRGLLAGRRIVVVDPVRCNGCGRCIAVCTREALSRKDGKLLVLPDLCVGCGRCSGRCPRGALEILETAIGEWQVGIGSTGREVEVKFTPGNRDASSQVVALLRIARVEAKRFGIEVVVVDLVGATDALVRALVAEGLDLAGRAG